MPETADPFAREAAAVGERLATAETRLTAMEQLTNVKLDALRESVTGVVRLVGDELSHRLEKVEHGQVEFRAWTTQRNEQAQHLEQAMTAGFDGVHQRQDYANGRTGRLEARIEAIELLRQQEREAALLAGEHADGYIEGRQAASFVISRKRIGTVLMGAFAGGGALVGAAWKALEMWS